MSLRWAHRPLCLFYHGALKYYFDDSFFPAGRTVSVDGVHVTQKDVSATNGVIHVIDSVLVPASVKPQLANL